MDKEIQYQRDLGNAYMLIRAGTGQGDFRRRMVLENRIPQALFISQGTGRETGMYRYQISSRISLAEYLQHSPLRLPVCKQLVYALCKSLRRLGEYLLTEENLLILPETIYMEKSGQDKQRTALGTPESEEWDFFFCLYPDEIQDARTALKDLLKYLMEKTDPAEKTETSCAWLLYELYQRTLKENFCAAEFLQVMEELSQDKRAGNPGQDYPRGNAPQSGRMDLERKRTAGLENRGVSGGGYLMRSRMRWPGSRKRREGVFSFLPRLK